MFRYPRTIQDGQARPDGIDLMTLPLRRREVGTVQPQCNIVLNQYRWNTYQPLQIDEEGSDYVRLEECHNCRMECAMYLAQQLRIPPV
jgi:hypothetical protein